ncbi:unnamed protein product [Darwinula stevensoni]|uniref:Peptidase S1 domain-containing protein n=1 Tax=Darwinula stevensoni TaxID=69355 RepID=A0A7R8X6U4_9CRUS|nr:unnamed protein product [Darwinula stevensoni]CAG0887969.1 unnamed protein product [Darwinula stevensoni]
MGHSFIVRLGEHDLKSNDHDTSEDYNVTEVVIHPEWEAGNSRSAQKYHDIGLIRLDREVPIKGFIHPACLPTEEYISPRILNVTVAGWGTTSFS